MYSNDNGCRFKSFSFFGTSNMLFLLYFSVVCILYNTLGRWVVIFSLFQNRKRFLASVLLPKPQIQEGATLHKYPYFRLTYFRIDKKKNQFASAFSINCVDFVFRYKIGDVEFVIILWADDFFRWPRIAYTAHFQGVNIKQLKAISGHKVRFIFIKNHLLFPSHFIKSQFWQNNIECAPKILLPDGAVIPIVILSHLFNLQGYSLACLSQRQPFLRQFTPIIFLYWKWWVCVSKKVVSGLTQGTWSMHTRFHIYVAFIVSD